MIAIRFLLRQSPVALISAALLGTISGLGSAALLVLVHTAVSGGRRDWAIASAFSVLAIAVAASRLASQYLLARLTQQAMTSLLDRICRRVIAAPLSHIEQLGQHRIQAALTQDVNVIVSGLTSIPMLLLHASLLLCGSIYLGFLSRLVLGAVVGFIVVCVIGFRIAMAWSVGYMRRARHDVDELFQHFRGLTAGVKELKLNAAKRHAFLTELLQKTAESYRSNNLAASLILAASGSLAQLQFFALIGLLIFAVPDVAGIDLRVVAGYTIVLLYMVAPIDFLSNALPALGRATVALKRLEELGVSLAAQTTESQASVATARAWQLIQLSAVTHTYRNERDGSTFLLGPVDLAVRRGEILFIVGGNGSGKTTLIKLLTALYSCETGTVSIDGRPITDQNRDEYRQRFSAVFSDFHLFDRLIGHDGARIEERARLYLAKLQLDAKVTVDGNRLSTIELSQGQRRRLALLSAYLEDRDVFVFDEWAADQDPAFKQMFYREFLPELKRRGKTCIVVTHDDRYFDAADAVVKLESGRVVADSVVAYGA